MVLKIIICCATHFSLNFVVLLVKVSTLAHIPEGMSNF